MDKYKNIIILYLIPYYNIVVNFSQLHTVVVFDKKINMDLLLKNKGTDGVNDYGEPPQY